MQTWNQITARLKTGRTLADGKYRITATDDKGLTAERIATGSRVRVTRAAIEKADARLATGVLVPRRSFSYTVAIETLIVSALGPAACIETTDAAGVRCYARPGGAR